MAPSKSSQPTQKPKYTVSNYFFSKASPSQSPRSSQTGSPAPSKTPSSSQSKPKLTESNGTRDASRLAKGAREEDAILISSDSSTDHPASVIVLNSSSDLSFTSPRQRSSQNAPSYKPSKSSSLAPKTVTHGNSPLVHTSNGAKQTKRAQSSVSTRSSPVVEQSVKALPKPTTQSQRSRTTTKSVSSDDDDITMLDGPPPSSQSPRKPTPKGIPSNATFINISSSTEGSSRNDGSILNQSGGARASFLPRPNTPSSKREASSPPSSPASSKKQKLSSSSGSSKAKYILDGEIIPSSECDEEMDFPPIERPSFSVVDQSTPLNLRHSTDPFFNDVSMDAAESSVTDLSCRVSLAGTETSEMEVDRELDEEDAHDMAHEADDETSAHMDNQPPSDTESIDSSKAIHRALTTTVEKDDDEDDDFFDDAFLGPAIAQSPVKVVVTAHHDPKGKGKADAILPTTPTTSPEISRIRKAQNTLVSDSPLTPPTSPQKKVTLSASPLHFSPSPTKNPSSRPTQGRMVVEIPRLPEHVAAMYRLTTPAEFEGASSSTTTATSRATSSKPLNAPQKKVRLPKSEGTMALDALLKEKKTFDKKYGSLLSRPDLAQASKEGSPVTDTARTTPFSDAGTSSVAAGSLLPSPAKFTNLLVSGEDEEKEAERRQRAMEIEERSTLWAHAQANEAGPSSRRGPTFPAGQGYSTALVTIGVAYSSGNSHLVATLLQLGLLSTAESLPDEIVDWLVDVCVLSQDGSVGQATLSCLEHIFSSPDGLMADVVLDFGTVQRLLVGLGAWEDLLSLIPRDEEEMDVNGAFSCHFALPKERTPHIRRLVKLIDLFACADQIDVPDIPKMVTVLMLLALDPSTPPSCCDDITLALQNVMRNLDRAKAKRVVRLEIDVCLAVLSIIEGRTVFEATSLLRIFPRRDERTNRISRWIALGALRKAGLINSLTYEKFLLPPSIGLLLPMMPPADESSETPTTITKLAIDDATDYEELEAAVDLLGFVLTDLVLTTRQEGGVDRLDYFAQSLGRLTAKVVEKTGGDIERTRAKGEMQRLKIRLTYQMSGRGGLDPYKKAIQSNLKSFFQPKQQA